MRLLELEIKNTRGIIDLKLSPNGKNIVVWGPNGSGKSAVVDALDFLLTGRISRLVGEGTSGISLKAHGPHIDHKPKDAIVSARIKIPGFGKPVLLRRSMAKPTKLEYPSEAEDALKPVLELAAKGQHVLSRREILKYVAAEAGKRSAEVQALLNLSELEDIRKNFGRILNTAKAEQTSADVSLRASQEVVKTTLGLTVFTTEDSLAAVNKLRNILGGQSLAIVESSKLKSGIVAPSAGAKQQTLNPQILRQDLSSLSKSHEGAEAAVAKADRELRGLLTSLRQDQAALNEIGKLKLFALGLSLIPVDGSCPLCGTKWPAGELHKHIETHLKDAKSAAGKVSRIQSLANDIAVAAKALQDYIDRLSTGATQLGMNAESAVLAEWSAKLSLLVETLKEPVDRYPATGQEEAQVAHLLIPKEAKESAERVASEAEKRIPAVSPQQTAWDTLTRLEENWRQYEKSRTKSNEATLFFERAKAIDKCFEEARDQVLSSLYKEIETRFSDLYRFIHSDDETKFESSLRPDGASLIFEVDFHGRGKYPPLALHSEGHQDTMGLCLYLALAEKLTANVIDLTILDDVVMSVDAGHRRQVCSLLATKFPQRQFLITTHDRTWARQLVTTAVVNKQNSIEFARWTIDTGPQVALEADEADFWSKIQSEIDSGDIPAAAARLRRGAEQFFENVCDNLQGTVRYRSDGRYELSDFTSGVIAAYKKYLRQAKAAAQSWKDSSTLTTLQELDSVAAQIINRSQVEQWAVNENVHYNRWGEFLPEDFRPVCEAWRDLLNLFVCATCGGTVFVALSDNQAAVLRCTCGKINWNLLKKPLTEDGNGGQQPSPV